MKKVFLTLAFGAVFIISSFSQQNAKAFEHLSVGIEAGTTGFGLELATPLHKNFALRGGLSLFPISFNTDFSADLAGDIKTRINETIDSYPALKNELSARGLPTNANDIDTKMKASAKLGLINGKILVDYYPWAEKSFHLTAGMYFGSNKLVDVESAFPAKSFEIFDLLKEYGGDDFYDESIVDGYSLTLNDLRKLEASIKTNAVKPYFGLGFGRAIPKNRVGVQFDLGTFYHGTPKLTSENSEIQRMLNTKLDGDIIEFMEKVKFYPVMTLKISYRIF